MIKIDHLNKYFGRLHVLNDICLDLTKGNIYAIVGPNASGKTTLIKSILGLVKPDHGNIHVNGIRVNGDFNYREALGYMPQIARFPENLSAQEIIYLVRDLRGNPAQTDQELMNRFKIQTELNKKLKNLSGGTRQKISAVIAFLFHPDILILDEPTAGLDPISSSILKDKILDAKNAGKTVILTSHIMSEVEELANQIIFLLDGEIRFKGSIDMFQKHTQEQKLERAIASMMEND